MALQDASGESLGGSQYVGLPTKAVLSQTFCGSYAYTWTEILQEQPYNPFLADTWSARIILYALLLGCMPFDATNLLCQTQRPPVFPQRQPPKGAKHLELPCSFGAPLTSGSC